MTGTKNRTLRNPPATWFQVSGYCMAPLIRKGDLVMATPVAGLRTGDIVVVSHPLPVVHRVVKVDKRNCVLTKGDMSLRLDSPLAQDNLPMKVVAIVRKGSKPVSMEGKLWRLENYLMARYSLASLVLWDSVSRHKRLVGIGRRFSAPLKRLYTAVFRVLTRFAAIQT